MVKKQRKKPEHFHPYFKQVDDCPNSTIKWTRFMCWIWSKWTIKSSVKWYLSEVLIINQHMFNTLIWSFYWWFWKCNCSWSLNTCTSCIPIHIRKIEVQETLHGVNAEYMNRIKINPEICTELCSSYEEWFSGSWMIYLSALQFYSFDFISNKHKCWFYGYTIPKITFGIEQPWKTTKCMLLVKN